MIMRFRCDHHDWHLLMASPYGISLWHLLLVSDEFLYVIAKPIHRCSTGD